MILILLRVLLSDYDTKILNGQIRIKIRTDETCKTSLTGRTCLLQTSSITASKLKRTSRPSSNRFEFTPKFTSRK